MGGFCLGVGKWDDDVFFLDDFFENLRVTLRRIGYFITLDSSLVNNLGDFKDEWGASKELHKFI